MALQYLLYFTFSERGLSERSSSAHIAVIKDVLRVFIDLSIIHSKIRNIYDAVRRVLSSTSMSPKHLRTFLVGGELNSSFRWIGDEAA